MRKYDKRKTYYTTKWWGKHDIATSNGMKVGATRLATQHSNDPIRSELVTCFTAYQRDDTYIPMILCTA